MRVSSRPSRRLPAALSLSLDARRGGLHFRYNSRRGCVDIALSRDVGASRLGQMITDVAGFVNMAALHNRPVSKDVAQRLAERLSAAAASNIREATLRNCARCNFSLSQSYRSQGVFPWRGRRTQARHARHRTVACHALPARVASPGRELTGDMSAPAEVDLVRCLTFERGVGSARCAWSRRSRRAASPSRCCRACAGAANDV